MFLPFVFTTLHSLWKLTFSIMIINEKILRWKFFSSNILINKSLFYSLTRKWFVKMVIKIDHPPEKNEYFTFQENFSG